jgi:DNA adenine methylase
MIFRYPGGKTKAIKKIMQYVSNPIAEYREPFVGGGALFFSVPPTINRWINDIDEDLISVYKALRDYPIHFIKLCRTIEPHKKEEYIEPPIYNKRLKKQFDDLAYNTECNQALRYLFVNRTVWAGRVNYNIPSRMYFSNPTGWNIVKGNKLEQAAKILQNADITSVDYSKILLQSGRGVFIYCDPPYIVNTKLTKCSQLYRYNFTLEDHIRFRDIVLQSPHKILISYDDDKDGIVRELFKDFNIYETSWTYCGTSSKIKQRGKELIITNYKVQQ